MTATAGERVGQGVARQHAADTAWDAIRGREMLARERAATLAAGELTLAIAEAAPGLTVVECAALSAALLADYRVVPKAGTPARREPARVVAW